MKNLYELNILTIILIFLHDTYNDLQRNYFNKICIEKINEFLTKILAFV